MTCLIANERIIAATNALSVDILSGTSHRFIDIPAPASDELENDKIIDITLSPDEDSIAIITSTSKRLVIIGVNTGIIKQTFILHRNASKIRFTSNKQILVADKTGDAYLYNLEEDKQNEEKLLGHHSLLLDILQTNDTKFIITSDRDEKIKVSCYPNTYNIQTYCLGHKEFVNHIEVIKDSTLISTSGDGTIKLWNYVIGKLLYTIDTNNDLQETQAKEEFMNSMDKEGIQVSTLPIIDFGVSKIDGMFLVAVTLYNLPKIYIFSIIFEHHQISHSKLLEIPVETFPSSLQLVNNKLFAYCSHESIVYRYAIDPSNKKYNLEDKLVMFENMVLKSEQNHEMVRILYKRKFDNVQEYQERKKQRLLQA